MPVLAGAIPNLRPRMIQWELTRACKLSCLHCPIGTQQRRSPLELSTYEAYKTIDQIVGLAGEELLLTGGDPLERPDVYQLIDYARRRGLNPTLALSATPSLTGTAIGKLRQHGLERIALSIDSAVPDRHDAVRGIPGQFSATLMAIRWARNANLSVEVSTLVTRRNADELETIGQLLAELGVARWNLYFLVPIGDSRHLPGLTAAQMEDVFGVIDGISKIAPFDIRVFEAPQFRRFLLQQAVRRQQQSIDKLFSDENVVSDDASRDVRSRAISDRNELLFISHTGEVSISQFLPVTVGNTRYHPLSFLFARAEMLSALRDVVNLKGKCGRCEFRRVCGGSRARAFAMTGDLFAADPLCTYEPGAFVPPATTIVRRGAP
jgi:AdoMet-dependent heme synthase